MPARRAPLTAGIAAPLLIAAALLLVPGPSAFPASPELEAALSGLLAERPLPPGVPASRLALSWRAADKLGDNDIVIERRWKAPALPFLDPRESLSRREALDLGLRELASMGLPERVPMVEGRWPGEPGYPFEEDLVLEPRAPAGATPPAAATGAASSEAEEGELDAWLSSLKADIAAGKEPGGERPLVLGAVGDIVFGPAEAPLLSEGEAGLARLFGASLPELRGCDILVGNLEGVVSERGEGNPRKRFQFRFPPETPGALKAAGFDLVLYANNHVFDFGAEGFEDSLAALKAVGLPFAGAGANSSEALAARSASAPGELVDSSGAIAFVGFGSFPRERYGFNTAEAAATELKGGINADEAATLAAIRREAGAGKRVVVLAHGGNEYRFEPAAEIRARYRRFIEAGAMAVLGSHPHVFQGLEAYRGGLIAYSLGNFIFTADVEPPESRPSAILRLLVYGGRVIGAGLVPVNAGERGTELDSRGGASWLKVVGLSSALGD